MFQNHTSWTNIPQTYLDSLSVENIELKSKIFFGLAIQKAHLNDVQRSILYNAICNEIETGCDKIQIIYVIQLLYNYYRFYCVIS